jgi:hypothetical protein
MTFNDPRSGLSFNSLTNIASIRSHFSVDPCATLMKLGLKFKLANVRQNEAMYINLNPEEAACWLILLAFHIEVNN